LSQPRRIYLDNAATSWPKPEGVYAAVERYQRQVGAPGGRGAYREAVEVDEAIRAARSAVAALMGATAPEQIVFTANGTDSLNLAIHGLLKPDDHVVTTVVEHNSVLRPLRWLEDRGQIRVTRVGCDSTGLVDPDDIRKALRPNTRLIALIHASNVTGTLQPAGEVGRIAREQGVLFLLDAAQTLGHLPLSVDELHVDFLAAPGHKGLLGPSGTGILYIRSGREEFLDCLKQGGTGSASSDDRQPRSLPNKYESGSHNVSGLLGLAAGTEYLDRRGIEDIRRHAETLTGRLLEGLSAIPHVTIFGPKCPAKRVGLVCFAIQGNRSPDVAAALDEKHGIQARAGFQCAALLHRLLGTVETGGTVRLSTGPFTSLDDIEIAVQAVADIANRPARASSAAACPCLTESGKKGDAVVAADAGTGLDNALNVAAVPGLRELWAETEGDPRIRIAILDGPVAVGHPSLAAANLIQIETHLSEPASGGPACQHGTHVASVIFGQRGGPVMGISPHCTGLIIPIFRDGPAGSVLSCSQVDLARAITLAMENGAHIINISGGQFSTSGTAHPILADVVRKVAQQEVCRNRCALIVAAAGNQGCDCLHLPGALPAVLAVGAMNGKAEPMQFSNWGEAYQQRGVLAPGENVVGAGDGNGVAIRTGTSYATPIVSGAAALLMSLQIARRGEVDVDTVRRAILATARPCDPQQVSDCRRYLAGRLDIAAAHATIIRDYATPAHYHSPQERIDEMSDQPQVIQPQSVAACGVTCEELTGSAAPEHPRAAAAADQIGPSGCGCGGSGPPSLAYPLGTLGIDFASEARRDSVLAELDPNSPTRTVDWAKLAAQLGTDEHRHLSAAVTWTLSQDNTPIYAIQPAGPFTEATYAKLVSILQKQSCNEVEHVAVPGYVTSSKATLLSGQSVPLLVPELRGIGAWKKEDIMRSLTDLPTEKASEALRDFLNRVYYELRNLGVTPPDRALNYAATNAFSAFQVFSKAMTQKLDLDGITVERSPICRPESDCWDVKLAFYDPENLNRAGLVFRFAVDVSDVIPVLVDQVRTFSERLK
jgi:cysteine desulfurase family protein